MRPSPDNARLTIESDETIEYKVFKLNDPDRLVIDIFNVDNPDSFKKKFDLNVENNLFVNQLDTEVVIRTLQGLF